MVDESKLNIKKMVEQGSQMESLSNLANRGVRNVKVLDEQALHELIGQAVDQVISTQTAEERSRILADARKQLVGLMNERNEFMSRNNMLEAGKNELVQQIEHLQKELKLRRQVEEQGETTFQAQLQEMVENRKAAEAKLAEVQGENAWLREEHDKMVDQLDGAQTSARTAAEERDAARQELEAMKSEAGDFQGRVDQARGEAAAAEEERARIAQELEETKRELEETKRQLEEALREIESLKAQLAERQSEASNQAQQELANALEEVSRLEEAQKAAQEELERARAQSRQIEENANLERGQFQQRLQEALDEVGRLREAKPGPVPYVLLGNARPDPEPDAVQEVETLEEEAPPPPPAEPPPPPPPKKKKGRPTKEDVDQLPAGLRLGKGLDVGTVNLVAAEQNEKGEIELRVKRNVFIDVPIDAYTKSMLTRLNVPYVVQGKKMYVLGDDAFQLANVLNKNTRRPMKDGLISPKEQDALPVMKLLIGSILGDPRVPGEVCFYSVPGDPIDSDLSVAYHRDLFDAVLKALGYKPSHIIEGHAVTFAELAEDDFTGIGISCGGGMFNVCVAYKSMPALYFSTARSGDWVDLNVAQALGMKPAKAAQLKEKGVDLTKPRNREEDAISIYYRNLIKYNITNIAERFKAAENMPSFSEPISIVFSGGTSMAGNFIELVRTVFKEIEFPIPVKEIRMANDPFNATAKGALVAAQLETASQEA